MSNDLLPRFPDHRHHSSTPITDLCVRAVCPADDAPWKMQPSAEQAETWGQWYDAHSLISASSTSSPVSASSAALAASAAAAALPSESPVSVPSAAFLPFSFLRLTDSNLRLAGTCYTILEVLRICGILLQPAMPTVAPRLLEALGFQPYPGFASSFGAGNRRGAESLTSPVSSPSAGSASPHHQPSPYAHWSSAVACAAPPHAHTPRIYKNKPLILFPK